MQKGTLVQKVVWLRRTLAVNFKLSLKLRRCFRELMKAALLRNCGFMAASESSSASGVPSHAASWSVFTAFVLAASGGLGEGGSLLHYVPSSLSLALVGYAPKSCLCLEHPGSPYVRFTCRRLVGGWICLQVHYPRCALPNMFLYQHYCWPFLSTSQILGNF